MEASPDLTVTDGTVNRISSVNKTPTGGSTPNGQSVDVAGLTRRGGEEGLDQREAVTPG